MAHAAGILRGVNTDLGGRIAAALKSYEDYRRRLAVYRQSLRELRNLSDRELADLGIHRSMITQLAHEAAFGK